MEGPGFEHVGMQDKSNRKFIELERGLVHVSANRVTAQPLNGNAGQKYGKTNNDRVR